MNVKLETGDEGFFTITEGKKKYRLRFKLHKTRLNIIDCEDKKNKIAVDKRKQRIRIQRWGDVDWHLEPE